MARVCHHRMPRGRKFSMSGASQISSTELSSWRLICQSAYTIRATLSAKSLN